MITKNEIDEMLALLPQSTEKMKQILNWASAYGEMLGERLVPESRWLEMHQSRNDWKSRHDAVERQATEKISELERSRDEWVNLHRQTLDRNRELEAKLNAIRDFLTLPCETA